MVTLQKQDLTLLYDDQKIDIFKVKNKNNIKTEIFWHKVQEEPELKLLRFLKMFTLLPSYICIGSKDITGI